MKRTFAEGFTGNQHSWKIVSTTALMLALFCAALTGIASAQDQDQDRDDPPGRVARLGQMEGSISFQPAGESEWVEAVRNRPMTTGDKLWADRDSRAEVQLGSSKIDLAPNTGFSFLNLDDRTVQIQLSAGIVNVRVYELDRDTDYEVDTPNQAFVIHQPGVYRVESSENGDYTVVTIREGAGESTGNGQSYTIRQGQRVTFRGTTSLNAEVEQVGDPDQFDRWSYDRERRYEESPSARYCSRQVVGFEDLDEYGDWHPASEYGYVWYPRVVAGWAPYHYGHWAWIDPWGWTWVDDASWGYAPFHYGRWVFVGSRWGWVPGPREVRPVYAPALVAFVGGVGVGIGGNVAWFPLGPREVYVPSYRVSRGYVNRVNVTNTTVNVTQVTNVYNTTIVNNNTTINNVRYVNRDVRGAVTVVPQHAFATAQPVSRTAVVVNQSQLRRGPVTARAAVPPAPQAVLGVHANTANRVATPPQTVASRTVIAKNTPPPPPASFAARQQILQRNPGMPVSRPQMREMHAANPPVSAPRVITAPPARPEPLPPAGNRPANPPNGRPENSPAANPPAGNDRPGMNAPAGRPQPGNPPMPNNRPEPNPPGNRPQPNQPENRPQPETNRPFEPPARNDRPPSAQPNNRPEGNQPNPNRPEPNPPGNHPQPNQPENRPQPETNRPFEPPARNDRPPVAQPNNRPEANQPNPNRPNQPEPSQPVPNSRPDNRPSEPPAHNDRQPSAQPNRPEPNNQPPAYNRPDMNRPSEPPARNEHPSMAPPNAPPASHPEPSQPRPETNRLPQRNESAPPSRNEAAPRPQPAPQSERPQSHPPAESRPSPQPQHEQNHQQKPDDKHK
ncbi:MAG TPA: DUF6600 domain-containing protein [Candidatus Binatia bacterium]|nr:DUF6600 domain-containing protein [Candidatus Binatia bacterium]